MRASSFEADYAIAGSTNAQAATTPFSLGSIGTTRTYYCTSSALAFSSSSVLNQPYTMSVTEP